MNSSVYNSLETVSKICDIYKLFKVTLKQCRLIFVEICLSFKCVKTLYISPFKYLHMIFNVV